MFAVRFYIAMMCFGIIPAALVADAKPHISTTVASQTDTNLTRDASPEKPPGVEPSPLFDAATDPVNGQYFLACLLVCGLYVYKSLQRKPTAQETIFEKRESKDCI